MADLSPCTIVGDSIAVGTAQAVSECRSDAKIGIGSAAIVSRVHDAALVVISAGSNDPRNPKLKQNLETIRAKLTGRVMWIVPIDPVAAAAVKAVAASHRDGTVGFSPARDRVHPHSYGPIAQAVRQSLRGKQP
jgi:hypothetical protein